MRTQYNHFNVQKLPLEANRITQDYLLKNNRTNDLLGFIQWYRPWRKYCFFPNHNSVWDEKCLNDIQSVLLELKNKRSE